MVQSPIFFRKTDKHIAFTINENKVQRTLLVVENPRVQSRLGFGRTRSASCKKRQAHHHHAVIASIATTDVGGTPPPSPPRNRQTPEL